MTLELSDVLQNYSTLIRDGKALSYPKIVIRFVYNKYFIYYIVANNIILKRKKINKNILF
jgi:hypothetical protein